jgi:Relaxase/Mobilisation nuclease domain.
LTAYFRKGTLCHIVFNRVDNNGKTISDKNDRYRNEKVCKQIKDKYNLTYGKGKDNVNIEKLKGAEQTKHEIYHAIKAILPKAKNWQQFESLLDKQGISIEYKHKGQTDEVQGVSFKKGEYSFKGSEVDRKFSYSKLNVILNENSHSQEQQQTIAPIETKSTDSNLSENIVSGVAGALSNVGGLLDFQPSNQDENEAEYLRQEDLKKKKKPEKRRGIRR